MSAATPPGTSLSETFLALPKAELHLHLEGSLRPETVCTLAARRGVQLSVEAVRARYAYRDFLGFIEAFKWVSAFLREPADFAVALNDLGEELLAQNVVYAEITLSVGVMLLRQQSPERNFEALAEVAEKLLQRGLRLRFVFDAVRQFGAEAAMKVVDAVWHCRSEMIVAFGIGGDELSVPAHEFRGVYDRATKLGLHRLMHAGEVGGPQEIRDAIELLGAERIGHGIAAIHDADLMELLRQRKIPLEVCPQSNVRTGALAKQLNVEAAGIAEHPLPLLVRNGITVVLSTDDPPMFHTTLVGEYENARRMGLSEEELAKVVDSSFTCAFAAAKG